MALLSDKLRLGRESYMRGLANPMKNQRHCGNGHLKAESLTKAKDEACRLSTNCGIIKGWSLLIIQMPLEHIFQAPKVSSDQQEEAYFGNEPLQSLLLHPSHILAAEQKSRAPR